MQRTSVGGVTVLWQAGPGPGPLSAVLTFGTGIRDETAPALGVTRVIAALDAAVPTHLVRTGP
ncbi:hypothetical protein [Streptomyces sp. NPDC047014]|uniref:hypothetical protein n=1 Tax=Streptomyces sp. NPDC047014 TaxID=3155736 RepID=UPI0033DDE85A